MKNSQTINEKGSIVPTALLATAFLAFVTAIGLVALPNGGSSQADIRIEPNERVVALDSTFEVEVVVESSVPVNVFAGEVHFNPQVLEIESINYNISIADLWAEQPWYSNGAGTLTFGGGTTRKGGFQGTDTLIKIKFKTLGEGNGVISISSPRILQHDGFGTDAQLAESRDAIFTVPHTDSPTKIKESSTSYLIAKEIPSTDLNGDGKQSIADISIFMINMIGSDTRFDFNLDGKVDFRDFNIILSAK